MVRVPYVDHTIGVDVRRFHLANAEQFIPVSAQAIEGGVNIGGLQILSDDRLHCLLVHGLGIRRIEFFRDWILVISEHEDDLLRLAGLEIELYMVRSDGRPTMSHGVRRFSAFDHGWFVPSAIGAYE